MAVVLELSVSVALFASREHLNKVFEDSIENSMHKYDLNEEDQIAVDEMQQMVN